MNARLLILTGIWATLTFIGQALSFTVGIQLLHDGCAAINSTAAFIGLIFTVLSWTIMDNVYG